MRGYTPYKKKKGSMATTVLDRYPGALVKRALAKQGSLEAVVHPRQVAKKFNKDKALRKTVKVEVPKGQRRYSHEEPRAMSYGEIPGLLNPDDGDPWDIFIARRK